MLADAASNRHAGEEIRQSALAKAERIADEELAAMRWSQHDLLGRAKGTRRRLESPLGCGGKPP